MVPRLLPCLLLMVLWSLPLLGQPQTHTELDDYASAVPEGEERTLRYLQHLPLLETSLPADTMWELLQQWEWELDSAQYPREHARLLFGSGRALRKLGKNDSSLMWMHRARIQFQKLEEPLYEAKALMQIGTLHRRSTDLEKATQSWLAAIAVLDSIGVDSLHDAIYMDLASVMFDLDDVAGFETYARKAIPIARKYGHQRTLATSYMARQDVARRQGQLDSAAYFAQQAQSIASEMGNAQLQAYALLNQGIVAEARERLNLAIGFYQQAAAMPGLSPYDRNTFRSYLAQALNTSNRHPEALPVWQEMLASAQQAGAALPIEVATEGLMTTYAALGQYQKAFQRAQDIMALRDSAAKKRTEEAVYDLNIQYQSAEKERENQRLRAEKAETELALQEAKNRSRLFYLGLLLSLGVLAALVLAFIYFRKNTLQEQKLLTFQAIVRGEESERRRLARDLHDSLGGILATVERQFGQLAENMEALQNHPPFKQALELLQTASHEMRAVAHNLMPSSLIRFGLVTALEDYIADVNYGGKLKLDFQHYGLEERLPESIEVSLYRTLQELIHNVQKHAEASEGMVQLFREGNQLHITVEDNGKGFEERSISEGMGLANIRSRIEYLNGKIDIESQPAAGTAVFIELEL